MKVTTSDLAKYSQCPLNLERKCVGDSCMAWTKTIRYKTVPQPEHTIKPQIPQKIETNEGFCGMGR